MIVCWLAAELKRMRAAGRLVGEVLTELTSRVVPGVTTVELDELAEERIRKRGRCRPSRAITGTRRRFRASINVEVIHGIPNGTRVHRSCCSCRRPPV